MIAAVLGTTLPIVAILTGALVYRYCVFTDQDAADAAGCALCGAIVFPIALVVVLVLWFGRLPEWRQARLVQRRLDEIAEARHRAALQAAAFAAMSIDPPAWPGEEGTR